jgi:hypothetical protein
MVGRCGRFVSVGGGPAYRGYMNADLWQPAGLPPDLGIAPVATDAEDSGVRIARTEEIVLAQHPSATHFRYPYVYGPYQLVPREWCVVRRILDRRPFIVLPDDGLTLCHYGYAENLAHALLLAIDRPDASAGQIYNCGDEEVLTLRQVVELIAAALSAKLEIVSLPYALAVCARPLVMQHRSTHRVFDLAKLRTQLGYRDVVPARGPSRALAHWLAAIRSSPAAPGGSSGPFDYRAEDAPRVRVEEALASLQVPEFTRAPGTRRRQRTGRNDALRVSFDWKWVRWGAPDEVSSAVPARRPTSSTLVRRARRHLGAGFKEEVETSPTPTAWSDATRRTRDRSRVAHSAGARAAGAAERNQQDTLAPGSGKDPGGARVGKNGTGLAIAREGVRFNSAGPVLAAATSAFAFRVPALGRALRAPRCVNRRRAAAIDASAACGASNAPLAQRARPRCAWIAADHAGGFSSCGLLRVGW